MPSSHDPRELAAELRRVGGKRHSLHREPPALLHQAADALGSLQEENERRYMDAARMATALQWLLDLKAGPRNAAYEEQKPRAWALAREALEQSGLGRSTPGGEDG